MVITPNVVEVTDATFAAEVLEKSKEVPVLVDFWAEWCGPCRMLGPILEKLAAEYDGKFVLAKLDVDQNPVMARQFQVQGIPAVKAFRDGRMVNDFTGALPEPQVRQFLSGLIPSAADVHVQHAYEAEQVNNLMQAAKNYQAALDLQADHYVAMVGLGRTLMKQNQVDEGLAWLNKVPEGIPARDAADALITLAEFRLMAAEHTESDLRTAITATPTDVASRYALASLLAVEERFLEAMDEFLEVIRRDRTYHDDGARKAMLALFRLLGDNDPAVKTYRQKLANALF